MSFAEDIEDDFEIIDDTETVTFQSRDLEGTATSYTSVEAYRTAIKGSLPGTGQGGQILADSCRWHIRVSTLAASPRRGDRVVSASDGTWEVLSDDVDILGNEYTLSCRKVA